MITIFVPGRPAPQGSKRYLGNGVSVESSKAVAPWRADIRSTLLEHLHDEEPMRGPVTVRLSFVMPRPANTPKTAPTPYAIKRPDVDKLVRAVLDAIGSAGVWQDDSQVVELFARKRLAEVDEKPGCAIEIMSTVGLPG